VGETGDLVPHDDGSAALLDRRVHDYRHLCHVSSVQPGSAPSNRGGGLLTADGPWRSAAAHGPGRSAHARPLSHIFGH
jgi:hypothetical protein